VPTSEQASFMIFETGQPPFGNYRNVPIAGAPVRAKRPFNFRSRNKEADVVLGHASSMGGRLLGLEKGLVKEGRNFDGELLQECITIESLRVCSDVTVVAGDGHAGRIHEGEVPGVGHTMQVRCG
jgi:hypothetical protein